MWKVTLVLSLWISIVCSYPNCDWKPAVNKYSGCPYAEIKSEELCQISSTPSNEKHSYYYNVNGTSEWILQSSKTNKEIKVKIPTGSFEGHLNGDKVLINGEEKASIDKEDQYYRIIKGHFYYFIGKCVLNPDEELKNCPVTKNGTKYQANSSNNYCHLLRIYRNENLNLTINEEIQLRLAISYRKGN